MRAMRYEVFAWADAACDAPGALDHPLAPMLTGIRAYGAWVRGEFELAVAAGGGDAPTRAAELSVFPSGLAERTLANVLYIVGESTKGHAEALRQIELAEESGNRSRLVHACYHGGGGTQLERCLRRGRRPRCTSPRRGNADGVTDGPGVGGGRPRVRQQNRGRGPGGVHRGRPDRPAAGNRWMHGFAVTEASGLLVSRGELETGCAGLADMVGVWYRAGDWSQQWHTLSRCAIALDRIGQPELAIELIGAIERHAMLGVAPMSSTLHDLAFATRDRLMDSLGAERAGELLAAGATLSRRGHRFADPTSAQRGELIQASA